jgi:hypothetical protein
MIRMITSSMFVVGMATLPVALTPHQAPEPAPDYRNDPRLSTLRNFFRSGECPAEKYAAVFLEAADVNELDWRLLPSLSFIESTGGKTARNNNMFGWDSGRAKFPSPMAGIRAVGYYLSHSYRYKDKALDKVLATYNPDSEYGRKVKSVMRRISPSE